MLVGFVKYLPFARMDCTIPRFTARAADPIVPAALKAASKTAFEEEGVAEPHPLLHHAGIL